MRIVICGHATLFVESSDQILLIDPVFAEGLISGTLQFYPQRRFSLDQMPPPTVLVITHGHFDHFHPKSWETISRDVSVVAPRDPELLKALGEAGFSKLTIVDPWGEAVFGRTRIRVTASQHDEPEFGLIVADDTAAFWHMADAEVDPADGERVRAEFGKIDVVACKYQPVVDASMSYLRAAGDSFAAKHVCEWLEAACAVQPRFIFPYASGLAFAGQHAWFNRYAFPLTQHEAVGLLRRRLGANAVAEPVEPGDMIDVQANAVRLLPQAAAFVQSVQSEIPARWEPVDTSTLPGVGSAAERQELEDLMRACLAQPFGRWLSEALQTPDNPWRSFIAWGVVWQLVVHATADERLCFAIDFRDPAHIDLDEGEHAEANFFTHLSGATLLRVLRGEVSGMIFWLAGAARSYEKIIGVRDGRFSFPMFPPQAEFRPSDPLTFFLRQRAGPH
jgi:L-ascorbate metabolism protein UlaG (beta-lactamase superfamily)